MPKAGLQMSQKPRKRCVRNQHNIQICANKSQNSRLLCWNSLNDLWKKFVFLEMYTKLNSKSQLG